jgi:hypothetical protein
VVARSAAIAIRAALRRGTDVDAVALSRLARTAGLWPRADRPGNSQPGWVAPALRELSLHRVHSTGRSNSAHIVGNGRYLVDAVFALSGEQPSVARSLGLSGKADELSGRPSVLEQIDCLTR